MTEEAIRRADALEQDDIGSLRLMTIESGSVFYYYLVSHQKNFRFNNHVDPSLTWNTSSFVVLLLVYFIQRK